MTYYAVISEGELRLVKHHLDAAVEALVLARHFAGSSETLVREIQMVIDKAFAQTVSVEEARGGRPPFFPKFQSRLYT